MNKGLPIAILLFVNVFLFSPILVCRVCAIENSWEIMADIPSGRLNPGVATVNGKIYVIGGYNQGVVRANQEYDPTTNTWKNKTPMPTKRSEFAIAVYDNKIYCIGGGGNFPEGITGITQVYDPLTDTWETKSPMPTAREFMDANVVDGKIYVIGGSNFPNLNDPYYVPNINEVYNPETDSWSIGAAMPTNRYGLGVVIIDDELYALGGPGASGMTANERYTPIGYIPEFLSWAILLTTLVAGVAVAVVYRRKLQNLGRWK